MFKLRIYDFSPWHFSSLPAVAD